MLDSENAKYEVIEILNGLNVYLNLGWLPHRRREDAKFRKDKYQGNVFLSEPLASWRLCGEKKQVLQM